MKQIIRERQEGRSLLEICLDVHMTNTGASERNDIFQEFDLETLRLAINNWENSVFSHDFDKAVYNLIITTLDEKHWKSKLVLLDGAGI